MCEARQLALETHDKKQRDQWFVFSTLALVGYYGLLRPGELCALHGADIALPRSWSFAGPFMVLKVNQPKNARQMGSQQFAEIRHPDTVNWTIWMVRTRASPARKLWPGTAASFRSAFTSICRRLELDKLRLSPASLRAGGATLLLDQKIEVSRIRFLGRWSNLRSLEHYLQVARAQQIAIELSPRITMNLKQKICAHFFMLSLPQFLAEKIDSEELVATHRCEPRQTSDVVSCIRAWGVSSEALPQSDSLRGSPFRGQILGRGHGRHQESSSQL